MGGWVTSELSGLSSVDRCVSELRGLDCGWRDERFIKHKWVEYPNNILTDLQAMHSRSHAMESLRTIHVEITRTEEKINGAANLVIMTHYMGVDDQALHPTKHHPVQTFPH